MRRLMRDLLSIRQRNNDVYGESGATPEARDWAGRSITKEAGDQHRQPLTKQQERAPPGATDPRAAQLAFGTLPLPAPVQPRGFV